MALPTAPTGSLTWTKVASANPGVGPDLYYTSATSSIGVTTFYQVTGGFVLPVADGASPDQSSITWTTNAPASGSYPTLAYAPINAATGAGLYLLPGGHLYYDT